jgi:hypothetical protein
MTAGLLPQPGGFEGGRGVDLIADALPPARPNALQGLAHPVIDNEHEQVAALQLNTESQGSHLRNRLLRLGATLWADPVLSLHPIHRSRLSLRPAFLRFLRHRLIPQSGGLEGLLTIHVVPLPHHHPTSHGDELKQGCIEGDLGVPRMPGDTTSGEQLVSEVDDLVGFESQVFPHLGHKLTGGDSPRDPDAPPPRQVPQSRRRDSRPSQTQSQGQSGEKEARSPFGPRLPAPAA